jgi:predicted nucleotidyltransferase
MSSYISLLTTPTTVSEKFKQLTANLRTDDDALIASRCKRITRRINQDFWNNNSEISHSRYLGSYGRGTDIRNHSDVDLAVELPWSLYTKYNNYQYNGQSALLQAVRQSIRKTYPSTDIGGDGQVVVVRFGDRIKFEVLPVFKHSDGKYTYPDSNNGGKWRTTNPVAEIQIINLANYTYKKKIKHLARMMRAWKQRNNVPIKGLLIDTLVYNFMFTWPYNEKSFLYYDFMTRDFLKYLSEQDRSQLYWKAPGSGESVWRGGGYFEYKANQAYKISCAAIDHETNNRQYSANKCWREIFGVFFP